MRCVCCNKNLNDYESTRKHALTGEFLDVCNACFNEVSTLVDLPVDDRKDLAECSDMDEGVDNRLDEGYNSYIEE